MKEYRQKQTLITSTIAWYFSVQIQSTYCLRLDSSTTQPTLGSYRSYRSYFLIHKHLYPHTEVYSR
jgi:hypothetical protein